MIAYTQSTCTRTSSPPIVASFKVGTTCFRVGCLPWFGQINNPALEMGLENTMNLKCRNHFQTLCLMLSKTWPRAPNNAPSHERGQQRRSRWELSVTDDSSVMNEFNFQTARDHFILYKNQFAPKQSSPSIMVRIAWGWVCWTPRYRDINNLGLLSSKIVTGNCYRFSKNF